jgi:hypothetical protein
LVSKSKRIKELIGQIAATGRQDRVNLILIAQHVLLSELGPATMRNIPVRVVGSVTDAQAAHAATGQRQSGAETLRGVGSFILNGHRFWSARIPPQYLAKMAERYPPRDAPAPARPMAAKRDEASVGGRPEENIPAEVLAEIKAFSQRTGRAPSGNWVRQRWGYGRDKQLRAIREAMGGE